MVGCAEEVAEDDADDDEQDAQETKAGNRLVEKEKGHGRRENDAQPRPCGVDDVQRYELEAPGEEEETEPIADEGAYRVRDVTKAVGKFHGSRADEFQYDGKSQIHIP